MATDSTELTFVRCPACRSLVPAMSSRCRMCGAGLDPVDEAKEAKEEVPTTRERKKTVVYTPGTDLEADAQVEALKAESESVAEPAAEQAASDPLAGFVDEVDLEPEPVLEPAVKAEPVESEPDPLGGYSEAESMEPLSSELEAAPKVLIEQGRGKRGGLSFSKPEQELEPKAIVEEAAPEVAAISEDPLANLYEEDSSPVEESVDLMDFQEEPVEAASEQATPEPVQEMIAEEEVKEEEVSEVPQPMSVPAQPTVPVATKAPKVSSGSSGLIGWLVSASNDDFIIELRGGKRFITGTKLKDADLVLDHPSISTPHAMLLVGDEGSCVVQDLMSDSGVFVRSAGQNDFSQTEERFELSHGQRVVFGELEFIVVLIPR